MTDEPDGMANAESEGWKEAARWVYCLLPVTSTCAWMPFATLRTADGDYLLPIAAGYAITLAVLALAYALFKPRFYRMDSFRFMAVPAAGTMLAAINMLIALNGRGDVGAHPLALLNLAFFVIGTSFLLWRTMDRWWWA